MIHKQKYNLFNFSSEFCYGGFDMSLYCSHTIGRTERTLNLLCMNYAQLVFTVDFEWRNPL